MNSSQQFDRTPPRQGFTVVELLVSIGIIALLVGLTVPAVQAARASARTAQCRSQLKQIILAISNYESTWGVVPGQRWRKAIAPHLEQHESVNSTSLHSCPSDPLSDHHELINGRSYLISDGTGPGRVHHGRYISDGYVMGAEGGSLANISDGLSQTTAVAERLVMPPTEQYMAPALNPLIWKRLMRRMAITPVDDEQYVNECRDRPLPPLPGDYQHVGYHHLMPPNGNSCFYGVIVGGDYLPYDKSPLTASSLHAGGIHVALADGSVRFISESIDLKVWRAMGTRAGGDIIGDF